MDGVSDTASRDMSAGLDYKNGVNLVIRTLFSSRSGWIHLKSSEDHDQHRQKTFSIERFHRKLSESSELAVSFFFRSLDHNGGFLLKIDSLCLPSYSN